MLSPLAECSNESNRSASPAFAPCSTIKTKRLRPQIPRTTSTWNCSGDSINAPPPRNTDQRGDVDSSAAKPAFPPPQRNPHSHQAKSGARAARKEGLFLSHEESPKRSLEEILDDSLNDEGTPKILSRTSPRTVTSQDNVTSLSPVPQLPPLRSPKVPSAPVNLHIQSHEAMDQSHRINTKEPTPPPLDYGPINLNTQSHEAMDKIFNRLHEFKSSLRMPKREEDSREQRTISDNNLDRRSSRTNIPSPLPAHCCLKF